MQQNPDRYSSQAGFTLIELAVVLVVLAGAFLMVFPDFSGVGRYAFNSETRKLSALIRSLDEEATLKKVYYRAWFDPTLDAVLVETSPDGAEFKLDKDGSPRGFKLRESVDLADVTLQSFGKVAEGKVAVVFNPTFGAEPFSLRLVGDNRTALLTYNPYSGRVEVTDG